MKIIKLTVGDIDTHKQEIVSMLKQSFEKSFPKKSFDLTSFFHRVCSLKEYMDQEKAIVYGSIEDEKLAGFVWFFEQGKNESKSIHVNHFVVDKDSRGIGVGSALWNVVEEYATQKGISNIELLVTKTNENAVNFYLKRNFEIQRLVMQKRL